MTADEPTWTPWTGPRIALPALAAATCAGYYLASLIGLQLRFPPATTSIMWPPNAVLTAALVLAPPRRWFAILLFVLPVHIIIQMGTGWPLSLILALFVTNCSEALIAAGGMSLLTNTPWRFDTVRGLAAFFLAAVLIAPIVSSFADAAVVSLVRGEDYWGVWSNRTASNVLAQLTVVPAALGGTLMILQRWRRGVWMPRLEAAVLALSLAGIAWINLSNPLGRIPALRAMSSQMPLALQLPFLLWAAMRFGPTGAGLAILVTSIVSAWAVVHGDGPFASIAPATTITALRLSLIVVASTLMWLATLAEERRQTQRALSIRLEFEGLLARLSSALVQQPSEETPQALEKWLSRIGRVLGLDCLRVFAASTATSVTPIYTWIDSEAGREAAAALSEHQVWAERSLHWQDAILVPDPPTAQRERPASLPDFKVGGAIPLAGAGQMLGALTFSSFSEPVADGNLPANLWLVGEVLAPALRRRRSEDALRQSEVMKSAILQSLTTGVAVIDRTGCLLQSNAKWEQGVRGGDWIELEIGANLLEASRLAGDRGNQLARDIGNGVAAVLDRSRARYVVERMADSGAATTWWSLTAVPLNRPEGGAVLIRADVTELRRAEMEAQRSRQELAHVARVSTVGEMTASLAHQLNQPLAAIMTNAQAAGRMLNGATPNVDEVREILQDIVRDDRRASDVIQRLRQLLRKGELEMIGVNLTAAIREIVDLVGADAIIRNIIVSLEFGHEPVFVTGDRVQLQQVILNLLHNAMEAMADQEPSGRRIVIGCREEDGRVAVSVRDSGPGFRAGTEEIVFEPFYTTKSGGMGMGLSIVRSIVEAHGGSIHATNDTNGGVVVEFQLPVTVIEAA
jgi:signal transduction histidine kinase/integral membrane sensor domain MASE1